MLKYVYLLVKGNIIYLHTDLFVN